MGLPYCNAHLLSLVRNRKSESTDHADDVMGSLLAAVSALNVSSMPGHADITLKDSSVAGSG